MYQERGRLLSIACQSHGKLITCDPVFNEARSAVYVQSGHSGMKPPYRWQPLQATNGLTMQARWL